MSEFKPAFDLLLKHEGGFVNNPRDPGGATKYGISLRYLKSQKNFDGDINHDGSIDEKDIISLTTDDAFNIYQKEYWDANSLFKLKSQRIANMVFGLCVEMGAHQATLLLQRAMNQEAKIRKQKTITEDGIMGDDTFNALDNLGEIRVITAFKDKATLFYNLIVAKDPEKKIFYNGWLARLRSY